MVFGKLVLQIVISGMALGGFLLLQQDIIKRIRTSQAVGIKISKLHNPTDNDSENPLEKIPELKNNVKPLKIPNVQNCTPNDSVQEELHNKIAKLNELIENNVKLNETLSDKIAILNDQINTNMNETNDQKIPFPVPDENDDLKQQRELYQKQQSERQTLLDSAEFSKIRNGYIAEVQCPNLVRLGSPNDGGKWTCNPWRLLPKCVVYSFGVGGDVSFENDMNFVTKNRCIIYAFDGSKNYTDLFSSFTNVKFYPWLVKSDGNAEKHEYKVSEIMKKLGHKRVDFVKMDIEGSEHGTVPQLLKEGVRPCQFMIEIHGNAKGMINLLKEFAKADYLSFSKEENGYFPDTIEFSFIHKDCLTQYNVSPVLHRNLRL